MRSFSLSANFKQTARIYDTHGTKGLILHTFGSAMTSAAVVYMRNYIKMMSLPEDERDEYAQKMLTPEAVFLKGLGYASTLGSGQDLWNASMWFINPEWSQFNRAQGLPNQVLPALGGVDMLATSAWEAKSIPRKLWNGEDINFDRVSRSIPGANAPAMVPMKYAYHEFIEDFIEED